MNVRVDIPESGIMPDDIFDVIKCRQEFTTDWHDLRDSNFAFIPGVLGEKTKSSLLLGSNEITANSRVISLGVGVTSFNKYKLLKDFKHHDYLMVHDEEDICSGVNARVQGHLFALSKSQINLLDMFFYDLYGIERTRIAMKIMDQRLKNNISKRPVGLFWAWMARDKQVNNFKQMPNTVRLLNQDLNEFVYGH